MKPLHRELFDGECVFQHRIKFTKLKPMIKCVRCGTENFETSLYCDECGASLKSVRLSGSASPTLIGETQNEQVFPVEPIISGASANSSMMREIEKQSVANHITPNLTRAKLIIERGKSAGKEFILNEDEMNIGRWDADNGIFPEIDLDADDEEAKVSRRHARIVRQGATFLIEDLGSTNGTFVNRGRRLLPGSRQLLNDGDEIIVGKTFLRFQVAR